LKLRARVEHTTKQKLSSTLRSWLPILQSDLESLQEVLEPFATQNPFIEIKVGNEKVDKKFEKKSFFQQVSKESVSNVIEALTIGKKSLYDVLYEQINPPLFPTTKSQDIAYEIIQNLDNEGYFQKNYLKEISKKLNCSIENINRIRKRFSNLIPSGVGAIDFKESFLFQLEEFDIDDNLYNFTSEIIENFESIESYTPNPLFKDALKLIKKLKNPPAIEFLEDEKQIIPDIFIFKTGENIEVKLNDAYYPDIVLDTQGLDDKQEFVYKKRFN